MLTLLMNKLCAVASWLWFLYENLIHAANIKIIVSEIF